MEIDATDIIASLSQQRNQALDNCAMLDARLLNATRRNAELAARIAELEKASDPPKTIDL